MPTYPKLLRTNGKLAPKFGVGNPMFGVGAQNVADFAIGYMVEECSPYIGL